MPAGARDVLLRGIAGQAFPGAVAESGDATHVTWRDAAGHLRYDAAAPPADVHTVFDLASLTKVLATTLLAMQAVDRGLLAVTDPVSRHLPEWTGADRAGVTVEDLLTHSSGLPAWAPLYRDVRGVRAAVARIAVMPLEYAPRSASVYSDLGFILLGHLLERVRARALDTQAADLAHALGLADTLTFRFHRRPAVVCAPTELDLTWRGRLLDGEVHDENAWALGGVAGHAGLFGTVEAVGVIARHLLQVLQGRSGLVSRATTAHFFTRRAGIPGSSRALGWDTMLPTSSCGTRMSASAVGHTGFTGTSLWIDPPRNRYAVLLTNRVHPDRRHEGIQAVRVAFHDALWAE
ncbi:MAG: serine hydrolase domain-containing protein [Vicinamibacterales bacterium]